MIRSICLTITTLALLLCIGGAEPAAGIVQLSWMSGSWVSETGTTRTEEHWTAPHAGAMFATARTIKGEKTVFFEYLRIEQTPQGLVYLAAPKGRSPATPFKAIEVSESKVVFENPEHDFPVRITYWRDGDGLGARVEGKNGDRAESWTFKRLAGN